MAKEDRERENFKPVNYHPTGVQLVQEVFPDEETVTCTVPKEFIMTVDREVAAEKMKSSHGHLQVRFRAGVQEIPKFLLGHWWMRSNGVKPYEEARKDNEAKLTKAPDNPVPVPKVDLDTLTKAQLVEFAAQKFQLTLSVSDKKEDLIAAIEEVSTKADAA